MEINTCKERFFYGFTIILGWIALKLSEFLTGLGFVAPAETGGAIEEMPVLTEMLPCSFRDIVRDFRDKPGSRPPDDSFGYQSLHYAVSAVEKVGSCFIPYVKPENLFFFFSERAEVLNRVFSEERFLIYDKTYVIGENGERYGKGCTCGDKGESEKVAVVLCKLRNADLLEELRRAKKHDSGKNGNYCELAWGELQEMKDVFKDDHKPKDTVDGKKINGNRA